MDLSPNLARSNQMCQIKLKLTQIFLLVVGMKVRIKKVRKAAHRIQTGQSFVKLAVSQILTKFSVPYGT
jgi:hypothetical protein